MSLYALDSDILSLWAGGDAIVTARCASVPQKSLSITVISVDEVLSAWYTLLRRAKRRDEVAMAYARLADSVQFLGQLPILRFNSAAIDRFESLKAMKLGVRGPDLRIAAIALEQSAVLVTRNRRDFALVPGLVIEDWSKP